MPSLKARTVRNISYVGLSQLGVLVINLALIIVIAQLLTAEDFGIFSLGMIFLTLGYNIQDFGVLPAVVQRDTRIEESIRTGLALRWILAIILAVGIVGSSPFVANYFDYENLMLVLVVISLNMFILPFGFPSQVLLTRSLKFSGIAMAIFLQHLVLAGVAVSAALMGYGYWSLVFGSLAGSIAFVVTLQSYERARFVPKLDRSLAGELMGFGKHLLATGLLAYLIFNIDQMAIGKVLGLAILGFYVAAIRIGRTMGDQVAGTVNKVLFPTMARIKEDIERLRRGYVQSLKMISVITAPLCMGVSAVSPVLVRVALGPEWTAVVVPLSIIAFQGMFNSLITPAANVLISIGKPHFMSGQTAVQAVIIVVGIYPVTKLYGIDGVCYFTTFVSLGVLVYFFLVFRMIFKISTIDVVKPVLPALLSATAMFVVVAYLATMVSATLASLLLLIMLATAMYFGLLYVITRGKELKELVDMLKMLMTRQSAPPPG